ncbi:hypothetical protein F751_1161 [Auxenochlorella protothecoides]|uniref:Uncharacterized protein n=1 Tax=Auxenochlorella protothecoides TaxID=3075 RepID=A0A087SNT0_AUXPR|nr:hypothetical protein F751_1161 [Auxenochlorella protothecoides]KFM27384.1 hypothetical protein F751_1161 [Auxenochlorella protothecoides]
MHSGVPIRAQRLTTPSWGAGPAAAPPRCRAPQPPAAACAWHAGPQSRPWRCSGGCCRQPACQNRSSRPPAPGPPSRLPPRSRRFPRRPVAGAPAWRTSSCDRAVQGFGCALGRSCVSACTWSAAERGQTARHFWLMDI